MGWRLLLSTVICQMVIASWNDLYAITIKSVNIRVFYLCTTM